MNSIFSSKLKQKFIWVISILLLVLIFSSLIPQYLTLYERPSFIEKYEYEAAKWIKENASKNTLLISDQASMLFLSGLTDTITLVHLTQNFPTTYPLDIQRLSLIYQLFLTDNGYEVYELLSELKILGVTTEQYFTSLRPLEYPDYLIVISPRTSKWVDWGGKTVIWYPNDNVYSNKPTSLSIKNDYVMKFFDENLFELLYEIENKIYIFKPIWSEIFQARDFPGEVGKNMDDAVLRFDFTEETETIVYDKSGNENDGSIIGATWYTDDSHNALEFNGLADYVFVTDHESLDITSELTLEAWIKPENMTGVGWHEIISKGSNYVYQMLYNDEIRKLGIGVRIDGKTNFVELPYIPDGAWHHIVGTYKSNEFNVYFDGVLNKSRNDIQGSINTNDEPLVLGSLLTGGNVSTNHWNGSIGEICIYNRILTPDEITAHFEGDYTDVYSIRQVNVRENNAGYMVEKLLEIIPKEETVIKINGLVKDNSLDMIALRLDLVDKTTKKLVGSKEIKSNDFGQANTYEYIEKNFSITSESPHNLLLKIYFADNVTVNLKEIFIK